MSLFELPAALAAYIAVLVFFAGACAGSFVNCASDRYIEHQSVLRGRSHCPACGHALGLLDLFPVLSYLFLRGRCRYCGARIPARCLYTELLGGLAFLSCLFRFGISFEALEYALLAAALLALSLIDFDTMEIPDGILIFGLVLFALFLPAHAAPAERAKMGLIGALALGGGILLLSLFLDKLLKKETLGGGDVKLFALLALFFGPWQGLFLLILSCVIGLAMGAMKVVNAKKEFPFGPAIALAAWFTLLVGEQLVGLYLKTFL